MEIYGIVTISKQTCGLAARGSRKYFRFSVAVDAVLSNLIPMALQEFFPRCLLATFRGRCDAMALQNVGNPVPVRIPDDRLRRRPDDERFFEFRTPCVSYYGHFGSKSFHRRKDKPGKLERALNIAKQYELLNAR